MSASENKRILGRVIEAALQDDGAVLTALVADPELAECIRAASQESRRLLPDQKFTIESVIAEGDFVSVQWTIAGTYMRGIPGVFGPKRVTVHGSYLATVERGRVLAMTQYSDQLDLLAQLGSRAIFFTAVRTLFRRLVRREAGSHRHSGGIMKPQAAPQPPQSAAGAAELVNL